MHIRSLQGKRICILGFGKEGQATLRALQKYAPGIDITVADRDEDIPTRYQVSHLRQACLPDRQGYDGQADVRFQVGKEYLHNLNKFDIVIKSPGIPPSKLATYNLKPTTYNLVSATQIFLDTIADSGATVIGVTGSKGKSTTASLIHAIFNFQFSIFNSKTAFLIGNIGEPALNYLEQANEKAIFVMELSSYQLMDLTVSPHIAIITSFFPEHLDYHGTLEAYKEAKSHIVKFQTEDDIVFCASQGEGTYEITKMSPGKKVPFSENDAPVTLEETQLIGTHNLRNIAGAWKVTEHLGIPRDIAVKAIKEFTPLPHRLQSLGVRYGIEWVDDAISTTPESTIAALDALDDRVVTIILGGHDRGNDFTELAHRLKNSSVKTIILFPGSGPRIRTTIEATKANVHCFEAKNMEEAVRITKKETNLTPNTYPSATRSGSALGSEARARGENPSGSRVTSSPRCRALGVEIGPSGNLTPICLLSTASPSYNMFKNFEEKGEKFAHEIQKI